MAGSRSVYTLKAPHEGNMATVDVIIGQAQYGEYTVKLYDEQGKNGVEVGSGNNADTLPDSWDLKDTNGKPLAVAGRLLGWTITIASPDKPDGQFYYARVIVREGSQSLSSEPIEYSGPLDGAKILIGYGKFGNQP